MCVNVCVCVVFGVEQVKDVSWTLSTLASRALIITVRWPGPVYSFQGCVHKDTYRTLYLMTLQS